MKPVKNLQTEQLETRLNLSGMHLGIGAHEVRPILAAAVSQQASTRIISIAPESGSARWGNRVDDGVTTRGRVKAPAPVRTPPTKRNRKQSPTVTSTPSVAGPVAPADPMVTAPDPLAPILAQLHGDDVHDDSATIQLLIDTANAQGIKNITLPAGRFLLNEALTFYGSGITFSGQGSSTVLDVNNHWDGTSGGGGMSIAATLDTHHLMISQAVTGNTIVFSGLADVQAGQTLFLSNGQGSAALVEAQHGGALTQAGEFNELGPDEYVTISSVTTDANGNTVVHLTQNVVGAGDYFNVAPNGVNSGLYLNAVAVGTPADNLTVENLNFHFTDMKADLAMTAHYTKNLTLQNINIMNSSKVGALGGITIVGSTGAVCNAITSSTAIALNSSRGAVIENCTVANITIEEACTDNLVIHNNLTGTTTCDIRINDMSCERNDLEHNTLQGGPCTTGAIGIWEGVDTTVAFNTITGGDASIWQGGATGTIVHDNIGRAFNNYNPSIGIAQVFNNSWQ